MSVTGHAVDPTAPSSSDSVHALAPLVARLRKRFDHKRQLPDEIFRALTDAGPFDLWPPRTRGGPTPDPLPFLAVIEELGRLDGSVGWCTVIAARYDRLVGALDAGAAVEIFGAGHGVLAGTLNPSGKVVAVPSSASCQAEILSARPESSDVASTE